MRQIAQNAILFFFNFSSHSANMLSIEFDSVKCRLLFTICFVFLGGIVVLIAEFVAKFNPPQDEMLVISQATRDKSERMKRLQNQHQHQQQQPQNHQLPNVGHSTTTSTAAAATPQQSKPWQSNFYPHQHQQQQPQQVHATKLNLGWKNCEN